MDFILNMITPISYNRPYISSPQKVQQPSFGSNYRSYESPSGGFVSCFSCTFRNDIAWPNFVNYINKNFEGKEKVNVINAACSDGSEVYSLLITMNEKLKGNQFQKFLPIQALDCDEAILKVAKSGYLSVSDADLHKIKSNTENEFKYIRMIDNKFAVRIENDETQDLRQMVKIDKCLRNNVRFQQKDVFDVLKNLEDDSNTILMFRNALGHLGNGKANKFAKLASEKLKDGSLVVVGTFDIDNTDIHKYLTKRGFKYVMQNVYRKGSDILPQKPTILDRIKNIFKRDK